MLSIVLICLAPLLIYISRLLVATLLNFFMVVFACFFLCKTMTNRNLTCSRLNLCSSSCPPPASSTTAMVDAPTPTAITANSKQAVLRPLLQRSPAMSRRCRSRCMRREWKIYSCSLLLNPECAWASRECITTWMKSGHFVFWKCRDMWYMQQI
jgi:hypothetical protein